VRTTFIYYRELSHSRQQYRKPYSQDDRKEILHMQKSVLITGAGSGFGKGTALALAAKGHRVIATTETQDQASALREEAPQLEVIKLDITNTADISQVENLTIDVLINNAGAGQTGPIADVPIDRVRHLFEVNVFGTLAITQAVLPQMVARGSGRIIIMSSVAGVMSGPSFGPYSMTKHALEAMGKALRAEIAGQGIDVTLINPGPYNTGFNDRMANSMWEWFDDKSVNAPAAELMRIVGSMVTTGQLDPADVHNRLVELVEADTTTENNFMPPEIAAMLAARL
jgi:short-subunit dehydrogenase